MHPEITRMLMTERTREQREFAAAWRQRPVRRHRFLPRGARPRVTWTTRTV